MTFELTALTLAALLQVVQFALVSITANLELGPGKTASPRDPARLGKPLLDQVSVGTGRLFRAFNNHFEGLILFGIACVVISVSGQSSGVTAVCAVVYLVARVLYVPAYYFGWVPWRSVIWFAGFGATVVMLIAALV
jgi:uncharacterized MAPEG superfamily protein